jgi:hypothetical protein
MHHVARTLSITAFGVGYETGGHQTPRARVRKHLAGIRVERLETHPERQ